VFSVSSGIASGAPSTLHPERNRPWSEGPAVPIVPYRREALLKQ
jgi:hypothetical protein